MVQSLHASIKGRARFKVRGLYRSERCKRDIETALSAEAGIISISASPLTGNVLIVCNSGNTPSSLAALIAKVMGMQNAGDAGALRSSGREKYIAINGQKPEASERLKVTSRRKLRKAVVEAEEQKEAPVHLMDTGSALTLFECDPKTGLSGESVRERFKRFGPNVLPEAVPRSGLGIFLDQFKSLPVALLGVAAGVSVATGGIADALVIMGVVVINGIIGYTTEMQAEKTIHSLKSLVRPSGVCLRNGAMNEIQAEDIVPGDILVLRPGSYVPADARLIEARHLSVDESALTGESMPVSKKVEALDDDGIPLADRTNMVFMGTLVTGGQGLAVVTGTGKFTEIGKIQTLVGEARPPETPMERQLDTMGTQLVYISGAVCGLVFVIGLLRGYGLLQMLKTSISLAVAAVPEGLPTVATTTLALGIRNMRRHNVLIRRLDAVETLGSVQTICLDKTGTITVNRMTVISLYAGMKRIKVSDGRFTAESNEVGLYSCDELLRLVHVSVLCSESDVSVEDGEVVVRGSATENALIHVALSAGVNVSDLREKFPLLKIRHRSENCNIMATLHDVQPGAGNPGKAGIIAVKGSPSEVLSLCSWHMKDGQKILLTEEDRYAVQLENERMAGDALRVLGMAYAFVEESPVWHEEQLDICGVPTDTMNLIWLGLSGMIDPIRSGVKELIGRYHTAGIDTVMITGDQGPTAYAIGKELNLSKGEQLEILDSTHLASLDPEVMKALSGKVHVFARVSPANKLQIVQSLQSSGKVVAMTGDGINDGPALKAADIGVAMGHTGTDVAREVADVVLEDDNLETMIVAISQGRTIYNNIRKSVHFLLSTNMSEIMVMFGSIATGMGQPLNAMQLLWINLISDIAPGLALALEPPEPDVLSYPPRDPNEPIMRGEDFKRITFESTMLSAGAMSAYGYGLMRYGRGARAGALAFMSLTLGQILHAFSCRSEKHSIFDNLGAKGSSPLPPNRYLDAALAGSFVLQGLAMVVPGLRGMLGIGPIGLTDGLVIGGSALLPLALNEATKGGKRPQNTTEVKIQ